MVNFKESVITLGSASARFACTDKFIFYIFKVVMCTAFQTVNMLYPIRLFMREHKRDYTNDHKH